MPNTDSTAILALHGISGKRAPKVPGLNAQPLQPSIGTDHWRISATEKRVRNAQLRQAKPVAGRGTPELVTRHHKSATIDRNGGKAARVAKNRRKNAQRTFSPYGALTLRSGITL